MPGELQARVPIAVNELLSRSGSDGVDLLADLWAPSRIGLQVGVKQILGRARNQAAARCRRPRSRRPI